MYTRDLIAAVWLQSELPRAQVEQVIKKAFAEIQNQLIKGNSVTLTGFGTFRVTDRAPRKGRNPRTGEVINLPESKLPYFKAGKSFKRAVN